MRRENYIFAAIAAIVALGMIFFYSADKKENKTANVKKTQKTVIYLRFIHHLLQMIRLML